MHRAEGSPNRPRPPSAGFCVAFPQGLMDGSDPPGRVSGMCTSQPSAMPALGIARGGSLPSTALRPGSTSAKRVAVAQPPAV